MSRYIVRVDRYIGIADVTAVSIVLLSAKRKIADDVSRFRIKLREAEFYFTEGEKFFILEDYAKALLYYQRTLEITPENATIHYKIAEVLSRSNKQEDLLKASFSIENALKLEKKNKYFYLLAANIYGSLTKFDKAAVGLRDDDPRSARHGRIFIRTCRCLSIRQQIRRRNQDL